MACVDDKTNNLFDHLERCLCFHVRGLSSEVEIELHHGNWACLVEPQASSDDMQLFQFHYPMNPFDVFRMRFELANIFITPNQLGSGHVVRCP